MRRTICKLFVFLLVAACHGKAVAQTDKQTLDFPAQAQTSRTALAEAMPSLANQILKTYKGSRREQNLKTRFSLELLAGKQADALTTLREIREFERTRDPEFADVFYIQFEIFAKAKIIQTAGALTVTPASPDKGFDDAFARAFRETFAKLDDKVAARAVDNFRYNAQASLDAQQKILDTRAVKTQLTLDEALLLINRYQPYFVYEQILPLSDALIASEDNRRYEVQDGALIKTKGGATLSATIMRKRGTQLAQPTALFFNIYVDQSRHRQRSEARFSAARGYVGVAADARGKGLSPDVIEPYEHEVADVNGVIEWISKQPWSDGRVGMYGGSYSGFAQWAAAKRMHPALKTIVPYVAAIPGLGLPMENNVFLNANYGWAFYVTNNRFLDDAVYSDRQRWRRLNNDWYESGRPYREIDQVDRTPNKFLQRWLQHPAYDKYWQKMVPYKEDFANINIPVLSITGYYDDGQISAIEYVKEHYKYNPKADHTLLIGPYDHFGAQQRTKTSVLNGYAIDPVAQFDTPEITFQWLDHILRGGPKPALLKDKINYQVMGTNTWKHAPSLAAMSNKTRKLYLSDEKSVQHHGLVSTRPQSPGFLPQVVDLADRKTSNNDYYPDPIVSSKLEIENGLSFISEPLDAPIAISGTFSGELRVRINKKDMDIGVVLYELTPNGEYFHLSYFLGRASYANDMSKRQLLVPGKIETISFSRTRMVSRQLGKGSRLLAVLNINKNPFAEINYGTGGEVSRESIDDAKVPLKIEWHNDSFLRIPVLE